MKKLIALIMTLVLTVSMAAMVSAANTQDTHDDNCTDCASVSVQPRSACRCLNSICGGIPLIGGSVITGAKCQYWYSTSTRCAAAVHSYRCPTCTWNYQYCGDGHLYRM